jgi:hypothetical protein
VLAYSGAAPELLPTLREANVVNASPAEASAAFYRDLDRPAPHNLYLRPAGLPDGAQGPTVAPLRFGPAPTTGVPVETYGIAYQAATFSFTWSTQDSQWLVSMNGTPLMSTDTGRVRASTVVRQQVQVTTDPSPVSHTIGTGESVVLRDGQRFACTWARPTAQSPTTFHTADGRELLLAPGPAWVLLTPD